MATEGSGAMASPSSHPQSSTLLTFLIADVRGYTTFTVEHGDEAAARLVTRFAELTEEIAAAHGGEVTELRGDEALAVFNSPRQALRAAIKLQKLFASEPDHTLPLKVGIGIDAGEALPVKGGYRGTALNLAARLCSLAGPGEVLVTEGVVHLARKIEEIAFVRRGYVQLKGFDEPVMVMEVTGKHGPHADDDAGGLTEQKRTQELPIGGFLGALPTNRLVGREQELNQVIQAVEAVVTGAGRLVMLAGEPGAGKTRLGQEIMVHARNRGFLVAAGRCYEPEQTVPYYPFLDALAMVYDASTTGLQRDAARRWPYLGAVLPEQIRVPEVAGGREQDEQQRVFRAVTGFLEAATETRPLAILLDDLHWADSASLKLLLHLASHTRTMPILLFATYRDVEVRWQHPLEGALRDLHRDSLMQRIDVRRLSEAGTAALVATTMGEETISSEFTDLVHRRTEGNPYFVQQVLRVLVERGDVFRKDGIWDRRAIEEIEVPESVRSVIGQRLSKLGRETQEALQEASVLGQSFNFDDLLGMTDRPEQELERSLEEASQAGLIRDLGHDAYTFDHALTQQSIYAELSSRRQRRLHLGAGEALEHLPERKREGRVAEIAWHFLQGDDPRRALLWTLKAGEAAQAVFAHGDAELQYRTATELAAQIGDKEKQAEALEKQGWMLVRTSRYAAALEPLERAAGLYQGLGYREAFLRVLSRIGEAHSWGGTGQVGIHRLLPVIQEMEAANVESISPGVAADLYTALAQMYVTTGRWRELLPVAEAVIPLATQAGNHRALGYAELHRGVALVAVHRIIEAREAYKRAMNVSERDEADELHSMAVYLYGTSQDLLGHLDEAEQIYRQILGLAEQAYLIDRIAFARSALSSLLIRRGRWLEARAEAERSAKEVRGAGQIWTASYPLRTLGQIYLLQGERESGIAYVQESLEIAENIDDFQGSLGSELVFAWLDVREGKPQAAIERLSPLRERLEEQGLPADFPIEAEAHIDLGQEHRAAEILAGARAWAEKGEAPLDLVEALTISVMLATRQGRWQDAMRDLETGFQITEQVGLPYDEALLFYEYGRMHGARREPEQAQERLEHALAIFQRLGANPDIERTEKALAENMSK